MSVDIQRSFEMHGAKGECGRITFRAGSSTVKVPTALKKIFAASGTINTTNVMNQIICTCDCEIIKGETTFTRHGPYVGDAPQMSYWIFGW